MSKDADSSIGTTIAIAEFTEEEKRRNLTANTITGFNAEDQSEIWREAKNEFRKLRAHLPAERQKTLWDILVEFKDVSIQPKIGKVQVVKAKFTAEGRPYRAKLRPM